MITPEYHLRPGRFATDLSLVPIPGTPGVGNVAWKKATKQPKHTVKNDVKYVNKPKLLDVPKKTIPLLPWTTAGTATVEEVGQLQQPNILAPSGANLPFPFPGATEMRISIVHKYPQCPGETSSRRCDTVTCHSAFCHSKKNIAFLSLLFSLSSPPLLYSIIFLNHPEPLFLGMLPFAFFSESSKVLACFGLPPV